LQNFEYTSIIKIKGANHLYLKYILEEQRKIYILSFRPLRHTKLLAVPAHILMIKFIQNDTFTWNQIERQILRQKYKRVINTALHN
jgi:hypothetical protein